MNRSFGSFLWQLSVALYLIANGVLGIDRGGDFAIIYRTVFGKGDGTTFLAIVTGIIALIAGIVLALELFQIRLSFLYLLIFIVFIVWAVYIVVKCIYWLNSGDFSNDLWHVLQRLAVHLMVLGSLLTASRKFNA
jgi:fumarate reductase subunit D